MHFIFWAFFWSVTQKSGPKNSGLLGCMGLLGPLLSLIIKQPAKSLVLQLFCCFLSLFLSVEVTVTVTVTPGRELHVHGYNTPTQPRSLHVSSSSTCRFHFNNVCPNLNQCKVLRCIFHSTFVFIFTSNSHFTTRFSSSSSSSYAMYPSIHDNNVAIQNLSHEDSNTTQQPFEHVLVTVPGVFLHLIEKDSSVQLASGDLTIASLKEGDNVVAVLARIGDQIQWPLAKDVSAVKLDESHYFFTLRVPKKAEKEDHEVLNYGLTIASKGQEDVLKELDEVLDKYGFLSVETVEGVKGWEVLEGCVSPKETSPEELKESGEKRELVEESSAAYWTTLAPNVEDYSGRFARWIAAGSGQVVRGILWCGDVTVERLKWGNEFLKKRMQPGSKSQISPQAMKRMKRLEQFNVLLCFVLFQCFRV